MVKSIKTKEQTDPIVQVHSEEDEDGDEYVTHFSVFGREYPAGTILSEEDTNQIGYIFSTLGDIVNHQNELLEKKRKTITYSFYILLILFLICVVLGVLLLI